LNCGYRFDPGSFLTSTSSWISLSFNSARNSSASRVEWPTVKNFAAGISVRRRGEAHYPYARRYDRFYHCGFRIVAHLLMLGVCNLCNRNLRYAPWWCARRIGLRQKSRRDGRVQSIDQPSQTLLAVESAGVNSSWTTRLRG